jgi:chromosome segregation ATPase
MKMHRFSGLIIAVAVLGFAQEARADAETDRLREALRQAVTESRALEDQRTALQATIAAAERDKAKLKEQVDAAKAEVQQVHKDYNKAVEDFNARLAERDDTLDKWKSAYEEAANVARTKDTERAKFEGEATAYKASTKGCLTKNTQLVHAGQELLKRYKDVTIGDILVAHEPAFGFRRVEIQNTIQDTDDKILDQKATP